MGLRWDNQEAVRPPIESVTFTETATAETFQNEVLQSLSLVLQLHLNNLRDLEETKIVRETLDVVLSVAEKRKKRKLIHDDNWSQHLPQHSPYDIDITRERIDRAFWEKKRQERLTE